MLASSHFRVAVWMVLTILMTPKELFAHGWKISPLATAVVLGKHEPVPYLPAAHLKVLSDAIVDAVVGEQKFVIVSMPPRHGKSWTISKYTPVWYLANWPHKEVINCGYGASFAKDWGREVRNQCDKFSDRLGFTLAEDSRAVDRWHTERGGGMVAAGIGGPITGRGADLLIIDDPIKNSEEAFSSAYRDKVWEWYKTTARTRLHPGGAVVIVMTRWHEDDLVGRLLDPDYGGDPTAWRVINMPAVWESDVPDVIGRSKGQALWPERYDAAALARIKRDVGDETWLAMYQQIPLNTSGIGNVYHAFDEGKNVTELVERDVHLPLIWSLDFNVNPMSSVVAQFREEKTPLTLLTNEMLVSAEVLDEISLPDSNTPEACSEFHHRVTQNGWYRGRPIDLHIYGDVSGNARSTTGSPSDWEIVRQFFRRMTAHYKVTFHIGTDNPPVRDRVNAVNTALKSADGTRRLVLHPRCKELRKDLKEVRWKKDSAGNSTSQIDKSDPKRTHMSDALGYFVYGRFRLRPTAGEKAGLMR